MELKDTVKGMMSDDYKERMYMLTISRFFCIVLLKGGNVYVT